MKPTIGMNFLHDQGEGWYRFEEAPEEYQVFWEGDIPDHDSKTTDYYTETPECDEYFADWRQE
jgi:hypothetical protein